MRAAEKFNKGFANVEFTASALVDMVFHSLTPEQAADIDPMAFQADVLAELDMPDEIVMRHATPHFAASSRRQMPCWRRKGWLRDSAIAPA
jgi:peptidyl-dipeptidase Dcp